MIRFHGRPVQYRRSFCQNRGKKHIFRCTNTWKIQINLCSMQHLRASVKRMFLMLKNSSQLLQSLKVQVDGPLSDRTASRIGNLHLMHPSKDTA